MMILSAGTSIFSGLLGYNSAAAEAEFNSRIAKINEQLALQSANDARIQGEQEATIKRLETKQVVADQTVGYASSGVVVGAGGSVESVISSTEAIGALDAAIILDNAEREARGFELEAQSASLQGQLVRSRGKSKQSAAVLGTAGDLFKLGSDTDFSGFNFGSGGGGSNKRVNTKSKGGNDGLYRNTMLIDA